MAMSVCLTSLTTELANSVPASSGPEHLMSSLSRVLHVTQVRIAGDSTLISSAAAAAAAAALVQSLVACLQSEWAAVSMPRAQCTVRCGGTAKVLAERIPKTLQNVVVWCGCAGGCLSKSPTWQLLVPPVDVLH